MKKVCRQPSPFSRTQERRDPYTNLVRSKNGFSLKDKKTKFSMVSEPSEFHKHEFQADSDRRSIQELNGIIESQRRETIDHTLACDAQLRQDQHLLHEQLSEQNRYLREALVKSLNEMEELELFQGSRFDEFYRRRLIENQDTIHELTARIQ